MAIYGFSAQHPVTLLRLATLADVTRFVGRQRQPVAQDIKAVDEGMYVVVRHPNGDEKVYHREELQADGGLREVEAAVADLINEGLPFTSRDFDVVQPGAEVEMLVQGGDGSRTWVSVKISGRSRSGWRLHVDGKRADGSSVTFGLNRTEAMRLLRMPGDADSEGRTGGVLRTDIEGGGVVTTVITHDGWCAGVGCAGCAHRKSGALLACDDVHCGYLPDCAGNAGRLPLPWTDSSPGAAPQAVTAVDSSVEGSQDSAVELPQAPEPARVVKVITDGSVELPQTPEIAKAVKVTTEGSAELPQAPEIAKAVKVITDHEVRLARERAWEAKDGQLAGILQQLLDFREHARVTVAEHEPRVCYNGGISELRRFVRQSGCQWWMCKAPAQTVRMQRSFNRLCWLCHDHADAGTKEGYWHEDHPSNVRWKRKNET